MQESGNLIHQNKVLNLYFCVCVDLATPAVHQLYSPVFTAFMRHREQCPIVCFYYFHNVHPVTLLLVCGGLLPESCSSDQEELDRNGPHIRAESSLPISAV